MLFRSTHAPALNATGRTPLDATQLSEPGLPGAWKWPLDLITRRIGPSTVVLSVLSQPKRRVVHLVNYNREEPPKTRTMGSGPHEEKPLAVERVTVRLALAPGESIRSPKSIRLYSPDADVSTMVTDLRQKAGGVGQTGEVSFTIPRMLIYTVAVVELN